MILKKTFYQREDVAEIAKELLGKIIVTNIDGIITSGRIVETEAYAGVADKASHAFGNRRTPRTEIMYAPGGVAYVYLCYGIHHLFNVVTHKKGIPHAVLIRAVEPIEGIDTMLDRRGMNRLNNRLTSGPGSMSKALGILTSHSGLDLQHSLITIHDNEPVLEKDIIVATRVGVAYAEEDALLPYRFFIKGNAYVSKAKGL